jgi:outer membrane lipoprotein-sorting protein
MKFLRTAPTRRLLAALAGLVVAVAAGSAIAVAAGSGGPKPKAKPLASALHQALSAKSVQGITADITFTNHLISSSNLQGSDPILSGATGRLFLSPGNGLRLELQSPSGNGQDAEVVLNHQSFSVYDPMTNTVYKGTLPADTSKKSTTKKDTIPSVAQIQSQLTQLLAHVKLAGPTPTNMAGQPAYTVQVKPKHDGGLLGQVQLGWDAVTGVPLDVGLYTKNSQTPVLELKATNITYGPVATSDLNSAPPAGAKVVKVSTPSSGAGAHQKTKGAKGQKDITGAAAVAKHVKFALKAPAKLVGLPRQSVQLLDWSGSPAALVLYGQNLGGIAVIEQSASSDKSSTATSPSKGDHGLSLPTVSIHGATGTELPTAIGTVLHFTRNGVAYTVLGSVPSAAAELAAKAL